MPVAPQVVPAALWLELNHEDVHLPLTNGTLTSDGLKFCSPQQSRAAPVPFDCLVYDTSVHTCRDYCMILPRRFA